MADWLRSVLVATAVLIALWGLLVALALRYAARRVPREVLLEAWPGNRGCWSACSDLRQAGSPLGDLRRPAT